MKIQQNITVFAGDTQNYAKTGSEPTEDRTSQNDRNKTIYAGDLTKQFSLKDRIQQKKEQAKERALKIINDAWDGDKAIDTEIGESKARIAEQRANYQEAQDSVSRISEERAKLRVNSHVEADSEEQRDLELLEKAQTAEKYPWSGVSLTDEERERLAGIEEKGLTEYQKQQLELSETEWRYRESAYRAEMQIQTENAVIRGIRGESRKHHPMADAQREAKDVLEAVRDEIIGMVVEDAKDHVDEEQEKREEQSEAIEEKREEQEEILERREEREEEMEELIEDMPIEEAADLENTQEEIQQEIQNMLNKMGLITEDIKGVKVDAGV